MTTPIETPAAMRSLGLQLVTYPGECYGDTYQQCDVFAAIDSDGNKVGTLQVARKPRAATNDRLREGEIAWVSVWGKPMDRVDYRRKGVATALLAAAREHLPYPVRHSGQISQDGAEWAIKVGVTKEALPEGLTFGVMKPWQGPVQRVDTRGPNIRVDVGGEYAGHIYWDKDTGEVTDIYVPPAYQRQGIATELWRRAREQDPRVRHSETQTQEGKAWAEHVGVQHQAIPFLHMVGDPALDPKPMTGFEELASYHWVHPQIATGGAMRYARELHQIARTGVTVVVSGRRDFEDEVLAEGRATGVTFVSNPTPDNGERKPTSWFAKAINACLPALRRGEKVYVHCHAGMNRGPSLAYAVLRAYTGWSHDRAYNAIKSAREAATLAYVGDADKALLELGYIDSLDGSQKVEPFRTLTGARADSLWGKGIDAMFPEGQPRVLSPWDRTGAGPAGMPYDQDRVTEALKDPSLGTRWTDFDPRELVGTQPNVTRAGVAYYMSDEYERTGRTFAEQGNIGNRYPVIYVRDDGKKIILTGHHRAVAALLKGEMLRGIEVRGPRGGRHHAAGNADPRGRRAAAYSDSGPGRDGRGGRPGDRPAQGRGPAGVGVGLGAGGPAGSGSGRPDGGRSGAHGEDGISPARGLSPVTSIWRPTKGMFEPGKRTLDPRVFDLSTGKMRTEISVSVMRALGGYWDTVLPGWRDWTKVYLTGSGASHWWDSDADMDILIGVDLTALRQARPANKEVADEEIEAHLNHGLKEDLRPTTTTLNGFETTWFVNHDSYDIKHIQPYAAYDITDDKWVVHPPQLDVTWGPEDIPDSTWRRVEQSVREAEAVLALPEPARTEAGAKMFDWVHAGRRVAYTSGGRGWLDPGNVIYQALTQHPDALLRRLYLCKHPESVAAAPPVPNGMGLQPVVAAYDNTLIARGLKFQEYDEHLAEKMANGTATAQDMIKGLEPLGVWWGVMGDYGDLVDFEVHAETSGDPDLTLKGLREDGYVGKDFISGEVSVVVVAKRPTHSSGQPWDPEVHNESNGLMGNSYLDYGQRLEIVEVRYDAGWGWKSLPARGLQSVARVLNLEGPWYHGATLRRAEETKATGFPADYAPGEQNLGGGLYLTNSQSTASIYARRAQEEKGRPGAVIEVEHHMSNPFVCQYGDPSGDVKRAYPEHTNDIKATLERHGHDGMIVPFSRETWAISYAPEKARYVGHESMEHSKAARSGRVTDWKPMVPMSLPQIGHKPRPITVARPAKQDIAVDSPPQIRKWIETRDLPDLAKGWAPLEAKHYGPLLGTYTVDVHDDEGNDTGYRIGCYITTDGSWVVYWVGPHTYDEAQRRMAGARGDLPEGITTRFYKTDAWGPESLLSAWSDEQWLGSITWNTETGEVQKVGVEKEHRRRGIATFLYEEARKVDSRVHHSTDLTDDGHRWVNHTAALSQVKHQPSTPLSYGFSGEPHRFYIDDSDAPSWREHKGKPSMGNFEGSDPKVVAFLDVFVQGKYVQVGFITTRGQFSGEGGNYQRRGLAGQLMQACYDHFPDKIVVWGKLMDDGAVVLKQRFRDKYPQRTASLGLSRVISDFLARYGDSLHDPSFAHDKCQFVSEEFAEECEKAGIKAEVISGVKMGESPLFPGVNLVLGGHFAVKAEGKVYDWTARQFDPDALVPTMTTEEDWRGEWGHLGKTAAPNWNRIFNGSGKEHYDYNKPYMVISLLLRNDHNPARPTIMDARTAQVPVPWVADMKAVLREAERKAETYYSEELFKRWREKGMATFALIVGSGTTSEVVAYTKELGDAWKPAHEKLEYKEPWPEFLRLLDSNPKEAWRQFCMKIADAQPPDYNSHPLAGHSDKVTIYRGISVAHDVDPMTSVREDRPGVGSSWTLDLNAAKAIAEREQAGFNGTNYGPQREYQKKVIPSKYSDRSKRVVLRAEVDLSATGIALLTDGRMYYAEEQEVDVHPGTEITLTGYLQAEEIVVDQAEKRAAEKKAKEDMATDGYSFATYQIKFRWPTTWRGGKAKRLSSFHEARIPAHWYHACSARRAEEVERTGHFPADYQPRYGTWGMGVYLTSVKKDVTSGRFGDSWIEVDLSGLNLLDYAKNDPVAGPVNIVSTWPEKWQDFYDNEKEQGGFLSPRYEAALATTLKAMGYDGLVMQDAPGEPIWCVVYHPEKVRFKARGKIAVREPVSV